MEKIDELRFISFALMSDKSSSDISSSLDIDIHGYLFDKSGQFLDCIYYQNPALQGNAIVLLDDHIYVDLFLLPSNLKYIMFSVSVYKGGVIKDVVAHFQVAAYVKMIYEGSTSKLTKLTSEDNFSEIILAKIQIRPPTLMENATTVIVALIAQIEGKWYLQCYNEGFPAYTPSVIIQPAQKLLHQFIESMKFNEPTEAVQLNKLLLDKFYGCTVNATDSLLHEMTGFRSSDILTLDPFKTKNAIDDDFKNLYIDIETLDSQSNLDKKIVNNASILVDQKLRKMEEDVRLYMWKAEQLTNEVHHLSVILDDAVKSIEKYKLGVQKNNQDGKFHEMENKLVYLGNKIFAMEKKAENDQIEFHQAMKSLSYIEKFCFLMQSNNQILFQELSELQHQAMDEEKCFQAVYESIDKNCRQHNYPIDSSPADIFCCIEDNESELSYNPFTLVDIIENGKTGSLCKDNHEIYSYIDHLEALDLAAKNFARCVRRISSCTNSSGSDGLTSIEREILLFTGSSATVNLLHLLEDVVFKFNVEGSGINFSKLHCADL